MIVMNKGRSYMEGTPEEIFELDDKLIDIGLDITFSS